MAVKRKVDPLNYLGIPNFKPGQTPNFKPDQMQSTPRPSDTAQNWSENMDSQTPSQMMNPVPTGLDQYGNTLFGSDTAESGTPYSPTTTSTEKPKAKTKEEYDVEQAKIAQDIKDLNTKRDAFARITAIFTDNNFAPDEIAELEKFVANSIMDPKMGPEQAMLAMRELPAYQKRFAGNKQRTTKGLNALSEDAYLAQEDAFTQYLAAAGQASMGTRERYATLIGNAVAPAEVGRRVNLAIDNVKNADPLMMQQIKLYYPQITDDKLVSYFLDPTQSLAELNKQVKTTQLGVAALGLGKGYDSSLTRAAALYAQVGDVGAATAKETYQTIGEALKPTENLSNIYKETNITYGQTEAEAEFFNKNLKAQEDRKRLKSLQRASFQADPGMGKGALSSPISI